MLKERLTQGRVSAFFDVRWAYAARRLEVPLYYAKSRPVSRTRLDRITTRPSRHLSFLFLQAGSGLVWAEGRPEVDHPQEDVGVEEGEGEDVWV
jgi:hypothetical protein